MLKFEKNSVAKRLNNHAHFGVHSVYTVWSIKVKASAFTEHFSNLQIPQFYQVLEWLLSLATVFTWPYSFLVSSFLCTYVCVCLKNYQIFLRLCTGGIPFSATKHCVIPLHSGLSKVIISTLINTECPKKIVPLSKKIN